MPIRIQSDLPAREILDQENIFVMDEGQADLQDIRPLEIVILNLMPLKQDTELQLLRSLSNTPLQLNITFIAASSHEAKNTGVNHLNKFYQTFEDIRDNDYDGMIITGAPVEQIEYEQVDYWQELTEIFDWTEEHVTSTMFQCWGAQAALYYYYGLDKVILPKKVFGIFAHKVNHRKVPLVRNFDDIFYIIIVFVVTCPSWFPIHFRLIQEHPLYFPVCILDTSKRNIHFLCYFLKGVNSFPQNPVSFFKYDLLPFSHCINYVVRIPYTVF